MQLGNSMFTTHQRPKGTSGCFLEKEPLPLGIPDQGIFERNDNFMRIYAPYGILRRMIIFRYKLVKGGYYEVSGLRKTGCGHLQNGS